MQFYPFAMKKLCDTWACQRVGLEKSEQSQNSKYGAWQIGLQPCASTGLHALYDGESGSLLWSLEQHHKRIPFLLSCSVDSSLRRLFGWAVLHCFFSKYKLRKLYTFSSPWVFHRRRNYWNSRQSIKKMSHVIEVISINPLYRDLTEKWTIILLFNSLKLLHINKPC